MTNYDKKYDANDKYQSFQQGTYHVNVLHILRRNSRHISALIGDNPNQPLQLKLSERLSDRGTAHTEFHLQKYPYSNSSQVKRQMIYTARDLGIEWNRQGWGMLDIQNLCRYY